MALPGSIRSFRLASRLATGFTLDLMKVGGARRDVIDVLVRAALLHANLAEVIADPVLQRRFALFETDVPDEIRRPAGVEAIAAALGIPAETARQRIARMAEQGACHMGAAGVVVPGAFTGSALFRAQRQEQYDKLRRLYLRLRIAAVIEAPLGGWTPYEADAPPLRLVGRLVVEYLLRFTEAPNAQIGDVFTRLVLLDMLVANTQHLPDTESGTEAVEADGFIPDSWRKAVSATRLARRLGLPRQTVRRQVDELLARGLCRRRFFGYIVPAEVLAQPLMLQFVTQNYGSLIALFAKLGEYGVLAVWERELREGAA